MNAYSNHLQRERKELRFLYDGVLIGDDQTPADLEMDDWDIVDCMDYMIGGGFC
ncbi:SUMO protein smt3 [Ranunculus cassubicifolius]